MASSKQTKKRREDGWFCKTKPNVQTNVRNQVSLSGVYEYVSYNKDVIESKSNMIFVFTLKIYN